MKTIRSAFGGTINDVVLAAVSGGYRSLLAAHGDDPDHAVVRSLVPVSTRHDDGHGIPDNRVSALLYELPVQVADPVERLGHGPGPDEGAEVLPHRRGGRGRDLDRATSPHRWRWDRSAGWRSVHPRLRPAFPEHRDHQCARAPVPPLLPRPRDAGVPPLRPHQPRAPGGDGHPVVQRDIVLRRHRRLRHHARHRRAGAGAASGIAGAAPPRAATVPVWSHRVPGDDPDRLPSASRSRGPGATRAEGP